MYFPLSHRSYLNIAETTVIKVNSSNRQNNDRMSSIRAVCKLLCQEITPHKAFN